MTSGEKGGEKVAGRYFFSIDKLGQFQEATCTLYTRQSRVINIVQLFLDK